MSEKATQVLSGNISVPTGLVLIALSGSLGAGGKAIMSEDVSAHDFASIVDEKIAAREEVIDLKLGSIVDRLGRMEDKLDELNKAP